MIDLADGVTGEVIEGAINDIADDIADDLAGIEDNAFPAAADEIDAADETVAASGDDDVPAHARSRDNERYLPSLADIAAACAEIQSEWSETERESRRAGPRRVRWQVPGIDANHERCDRETAAAFRGGW